MTFYSSLRDDLVDRSNILALEGRPARRGVRRRWPLIGLAAVVAGAGGAAAVAGLPRPASSIALETAGGPRGIAEGAKLVAIRSSADRALWEIAAFQDRRGGLGMSAATQFDPRPASSATSGRELLREISEHGGATVYGVVQIDKNPAHVVAYGAAAAGTREVQVQGQPAQIAEQALELMGWAGAKSDGKLGEVRAFAAEVTLSDGLTADRVNGSFTGKKLGDSGVNLVFED